EEPEITSIKKLLENHLAYTGSEKAKTILDRWEEHISRFVKVMPDDYKRVLEEQKKAAVN
ncbi:MAG: hypothetical protein ACE5FU_11810, partial [Nitrospinota bacterium]